MPTTAPFSALRYNPDHVVSLSDVIAPPYDVIDPQLQDALYKKHPANVIRVILNREEPGDECDERYERAAGFVRQWLKEGVLIRERTPAFYVYHQTFKNEGLTVSRRGFMARVRIEPFGEGKIYPHEETHPKAKVDRLKLTKATRQNSSQIFGLYPDPENEVIDLLDQAASSVNPINATDHLNVRHTVWPVTDSEIAGRVSKLMHDRPMFVADGHHRYETASNYLAELLKQDPTLPDDHPARFVMTMLVGMSDPGMIVLPTHRLLRGTPRLSSDEIGDRLAGMFQCDKLTGGLDAAGEAWKRLEIENRQGLFALYAAEDQTWVMADAKPEAHARMQQIAGEQSENWQRLGVSLLHRLVIDELLSPQGHPKPTYVHQVSEVIDGMLGRGSQAESDSTDPYTLAALVMPATLRDVEAISLHKERMPAKSTYFYPKLLSGLTFNPLS